MNFLILHCKAHWQNTQSQHDNQIKPKSLFALPFLTLDLETVYA